jgi:nitronate monooxygenase
MWPRNPLLERLGIEHPIFLAPMAGGPSRPELAAAVSGAGGLGFLAGGYSTPEAIRDSVKQMRRLTDRPFGLNLFVPEAGLAPPSTEEVARASEALAPFRESLGIRPPAGLPPFPRFEEQLAVAVEERVPVFSFTFGALAAADVRRLKEAGVFVLGTATTPREAGLLQAAGVDAVVAQGSEAGGHRGTFAGPAEAGLIGTMALVPQVVDRVSVPVVAAGGIMDGRGIAAALALGASAVQMGTAFLASHESGAHPRHKEAVLTRSDEDRTALTRAFTGRLARGVRNRFMVEVERRGAILPYPHQGALSQDIRQESGRQQRPEFLSLWAGQAAPLATARGAGEMVADLSRQARRVLDGLR